MTEQPVRLNIGCGATIVDGWYNYDNSPSLRLARLPAACVRLLAALGAVSAAQAGYIAFCRENRVLRCDAAKRIPHADGTVDVVYSSHMVEHLSRAGARAFLGECRRVLKPGGVIRLALPDLGLEVDRYVADRDADGLMARLQVGAPPLASLGDRLRLALTGYRHHQWMYDGASLVKLLEGCGFAGAAVRPAGETIIAEPGALDLAERRTQSVYVEAVR